MQKDKNRRDKLFNNEKKTLIKWKFLLITFGIGITFGVSAELTYRFLIFCFFGRKGTYACRSSSSLISLSILTLIFSFIFSDYKSRSNNYTENERQEFALNPKKSLLNMLKMHNFIGGFTLIFSWGLYIFLLFPAHEIPPFQSIITFQIYFLIFWVYLNVGASIMIKINKLGLIYRTYRKGDNHY